MKLIKKSFIFFMIFLLTFSNLAFATNGSSGKDLKTSEKPALDFSQILKADDSEQAYAPDEEVRVIVELEEEPVIYSAQSLGKNYFELSEANKEKLRGAALDAQEQVKKNIETNAIPMDFEQSFTTIYNGFSGTIQYKSLELIERLPNVGKVHITHEYKRPTQEPEMLYSKELVKAQQTWQEYGFKGEGMTVGVIDTGIDPDHKDMVLSEETEPEISPADVTELDGELAGKYYTEKVPYGYNYADKNDEILDLGPGASMHGMHVSGTVGANGDEDNGGIKGVAPEAQILGLKVFGNDPQMPSTYSDIYVKAIDDAIILGADVINMSLGSTASFVSPEDPEQAAIARAVENGVMMAISAGNSAKFGDGFANPFASNPDIGVVGSPGLSADSLQVAAFENQYLKLEGFNTLVDGEKADPVAFVSSGNVGPDVLGEEAYEVAYAGLGRVPGESDADPEVDDFEEVDLEGKIALIQRGETPFVNKALNAQEHGAVGVIIFNNVSGYVNMATDDAIEIPQLFILKDDGVELKNYLDEGKKVEIAFLGEEVKALNPESGKMASFTSWGVTPNLDFKPEITAPGGNILSTFQDDQYGMMSGTSMAAPHVAGGSALAMQRIDEEFGLEGKTRVEMTKNILMNTSVPQVDKGTYNSAFYGLPYSPRRQGAGLMDLHAAMSTPVVITDKESGLGKVALKEMDGSATFTLEVNNFSDENVAYVVDGTVQTDLAISGVNSMETQGIYKAGTMSEEAPYTGEFPIEITSSHGSEVNGEYQVIVPANQTIELEVSIDLTDTIEWGYNAPLEELFENGYFVEGFVTLTDPNDVNPALNVPYVGFNGEWDQAPILDETVYNLDESFYGAAGLVTPFEGDFAYLGSNSIGEEAYEDKISFSPDGDGVYDTVVPVLSFLRNAKQVKFNILDENKDELRTLRTQNNVRKNYFDSGLNDPYTIYAPSAWDGKANGEVVEDGLYYYEVETVVDYPDADWQSVQFPVIVDTSAPAVEVSFDQATGELAWQAEDSGVGVSHYDVLVNGKSVLEEALAADVTTYTVEDAASVDSIRVVAHDWASNKGTSTANPAEDDTIPYVIALTPEPLSVTGSREVSVNGYVTDASKVEQLLVAGKETQLTWDDKNERYAFNQIVSFKTDGLKDIEIKAVDDQGNDISFIRQVIVDSTSPELAVEGPHYTDKAEAKFNVSMKENYGDLRLYVNGSEKFYNEYTGVELNPVSLNEAVTLKLDEGANTFTFEAVDKAGNKVTKKITVYQSDNTPIAFKDIPDNYWAEEAIETLSVMEIINGYPDGNFGRNDEIIRVHAAQMIVRALGLDTTNVKDPGFKDVKKGGYGYEEIAAIAEAGIMTGTPEGEFMPKAKLKRSEMAKILVEGYGLTGTEKNGFSDVPSDHWASGYIDILVANEIAKGYPDGTFLLNNKTTRAEFSLLLARTIDDRFKD